MKLIITFVAGSVLSACAMFAPTLVDRGVVRLDLKNTEPVSIAHANVYEDSGDMVVDGVAKYPISMRFGTFSGHVDVTVIEPDGRKFEAHNVKVVRRRIPKTIGREASFMTRFPINPPKGTIVSIAYNANMHPSTD